ncbi:hypothetical protein PRZ48_000860 [Zasmidium cellare]|uniref:GPI anchored protein n=1 Tax=Zasmidium cellare TaxID=395010 RepID=A0ABR0F194_ZASCE|nr:hypothetical protein PRZ48_000860 [Zasmidium cellare]
MRCSAFHLLPATLLVSVATSLQLPDLQPFLSALPNVLQDYIPQNLQNSTAHDLLKRQYSNTCPDGFGSCANLGAAQLCCMSGSVCSADQAGAVACCPSGAACTGTISGIITQGTIDASNGGVVGGGGVVTGTSNSGGIATASASTTSFSFVSSGASTTSNNGLVMATSQATLATADGGSSGNGFIVDGTSTVATPGAGVRRAEIPFIAKVIIRALEYLPM